MRSRKKRSRGGGNNEIKKKAPWIERIEDARQANIIKHRRREAEYNSSSLRSNIPFKLREAYKFNSRVKVHSNSSGSGQGRFLRFDGPKKGVVSVQNKRGEYRIQKIPLKSIQPQRSYLITMTFMGNKNPDGVN